LKSCSERGRDRAWAYRYQDARTRFHVKLFPNYPGIRYYMRCHEQIYGSLVKAGIRSLDFFPQPFKIVNADYSDYPEKSSLRNIRLLKLDIQEKPEYLMSYIYLAYDYCNLGEYNKSLCVLETLLSKKLDWSVGENRQLYDFANVAEQMITLQKRLHKNMTKGKTPTREELQELIRLGSLR
jgi:hypothetical protein